MTVFKYCPECGGSDLKSTGWICGGDGLIRLCMDCEKMYQVADDTRLYPEVIERFFPSKEAESNGSSTTP